MGEVVDGERLVRGRGVVKGGVVVGWVESRGMGRDEEGVV